MHTVSCPGCGAPVEFRSHASVLAVCAYCKTTLAKQADAVSDIGRMAEVLEDYSPVQIGTGGNWGGRGFTVIGRIQLRYDSGIWNEWHVLFDDGSAGWLGDAAGQYSMSAERAPDASLPPFDALRPGMVLRLAGLPFTVADVRTARCIAGQGELPFRVGAGWQARVADLRSGDRFLTLDYSDGDTPLAYLGEAVALPALSAQFLRDDDAIKAAAGRYRGRVNSLNCPSCGASMAYVPGVTAHLVCPACRAQVAADTPTAVVLAVADRAERIRPTIALGTEANLGGKVYRVIGFMVREDDEGERWTEYLLYHPRAGFTWLVESGDDWSRATVLDEWPAYEGGADAMLGKMKYAKRHEYEARVVYVAGAFNWRVAVGDTVRVSEFELGHAALAREQSEHEVTWSRSQAVPHDQMRAWFGDVVAARPDAAGKFGLTSALLWLLGLNAIPLLADFGAAWLPLLVGAGALYFPAWMAESMEKDRS